jgi:hypothetical protein
MVTQSKKDFLGHLHSGDGGTSAVVWNIRNWFPRDKT